jgi:hypothetical protein
VIVDFTTQVLEVVNARPGLSYLEILSYVRRGDGHDLMVTLVGLMQRELIFCPDEDMTKPARRARWYPNR